MRKYGIILVVVLVVAGAGAYYFNMFGTADASGAQGEAAGQGGGGGNQGGGGGFGGGGFGGGGGRGFGARPPMAVEMAAVTRGDMIDQVTVVGNLIGAATVDAVPKVQGRLESIYVKLGDSVRRGQPIAKIEDREIQEQVKQQEAAYGVAQATIRQREAALKLAQNNLDRSKSLFDRDLLARQAMDDTDANYQAAQALLDLSRATMDQSKARLDELKINLANTLITAPVDGFIGKRTLDPGASVGVNTSFLSVVDIRTVRLVINVVEKDLRRVNVGTTADVEVDAFPGEIFNGRVARVAPILDPTTRTAQIEIEIPNGTFRLKPGMYARARFTVEKHEKVMLVPTIAVVDNAGKMGVFLQTGANNDTATFHPVTIGIQHQDFTEIATGLEEGQRIITTGAAALREGDRIAMAGARGGGAAGRGGRGGRRGGGAAAPGQTTNAEQAPAVSPTPAGTPATPGMQGGSNSSGAGAGQRSGGRGGRRGGGAPSGQ